MATTFIDYTGDGNATKSFSFPSIQESDIKVEVDEVIKSSGTHYNITNYTTTGGGNVVFTSGNVPNSPSAIRIFRDTNVDSAKATYTAGSSVKAADLNNNHEQLLFAAQEEQDQTVITSRIKDGAVTTAKLKADAVTGAKIADDQINSEHYVDGSIDTAHIADLQVTTAKLANDAVTNAKIADDSIDSEHYVDGSIDTAHIGNSQVTTAKIADGNITTAKLAADAVTGAKIADDQINSEHYVDGSIDTAHIADAQVTTAKIADANVTTAKIAADAVNGTKIADDSINSEHYVDGSIDTAHIGNSQVTTAKIADANITAAKIASNAVTTDKIADGELTTLAGMQSTTASNLASSTALTATTAELNQLDGITLETSITTNSDTRIPTSKAVNDLVLSVTNALGGFVAISNETSFPTANPDPSNNAGTVVSISQLSTGLAVNSSGVATISNGAGTGNTVTITGFPSNLQSQTIPASSGLQVQTTSTLHTYTFHKQLASAADIQAISATVNSFSNRYRVSASAPTSSLDGGDLWYDTTNSKLMIYSSANSAWEESSAIGNFFICTVSSSSNSGGGSATPNGTATRFTISNAPTTAAALIVSVDGVIQKPNAGSSAPSEGFVLVGNDIIFGAAPANGASLFVTAIGSTVGIGTPSNNTVTTAILQNGAVTTPKIADASVTTAKIANGDVDTSKLADNSVTSAKLTASSVTTTKIQDLAVTEAKIGATAVTASKIAQNAVSLDKLPLGNSTVDGKFLRANNGSAPTFETVDLTSKFSKGGGDTITGDFTIASGTTNKNINVDVSDKIRFDDNLKATFGSSDDIQIYHDGTSSYIDNSTGSLFVRSDTIKLRGKTSGEDLIEAFENGSVRLYHNNTNRFETTSGGASVTGNLDVSSGIDVTGGQLKIENGSGTLKMFSLASGAGFNFQDNVKAEFGNSGDLKIYHDGSNSFIKDGGNSTGLVVQAPLLAVKNAAGSENMIVASENGSVELNYDNAKKIETTSGGVTVTGTCTATAFAGDGSALTGITSFVSGMIIMYNSATAPSGWYLCDGNNGTPDLRDRFIVGAGNSYSLNATGGSNTATDTVNVSVSVSGTTGYDSGAGNGSSYSHAGSGSLKRHNHSISASGSGSDTVSIDTRSPYYALTFIMKA